MANTVATATRFSMPPESSRGQARSTWPRPTALQVAARRSGGAPPWPTPRQRRPYSTLSMTRIQGKTLSFWNTMPRSRARAGDGRPADRDAAGRRQQQARRPSAAGCSCRSRTGPTRQTNWPRGTSSVTSPTALHRLAVRAAEGPRHPFQRDHRCAVRRAPCSSPARPRRQAPAREPAEAVGRQGVARRPRPARAAGAPRRCPRRRWPRPGPRRSCRSPSCAPSSSAIASRPQAPASAIRTPPRTCGTVPGQQDVAHDRRAAAPRACGPSPRRPGRGCPPPAARRRRGSRRRRAPPG